MTGYLTLGRLRGARVRLHWTVPVAALFFGGLRFAPAFWIGFAGVVLLHELGHAWFVWRYRYRVVSIDAHGMGGLCSWSGDPSRRQRSMIAWGGILAQVAVALPLLLIVVVFGWPSHPWVWQLARAFSTTSLWIAAFNLLPVPGFDGWLAWKHPALQGLPRRVRRWRSRLRQGGGEVRAQSVRPPEEDRPTPRIKREVDQIVQDLLDEAVERRDRK